VIRAVYSDKGAPGVPAQTSDAVAVLRGPLISAGRADILDGVTTTVENQAAGPVAIIAGANSHIAFRGIDLTGVRRAELASATLGQGNVGIEIRLGAPSGPLLARADVPVTPPRSGDDPPTPPAPVTVTLRETQGVHDVYFVFKNNHRATPTQSLMTLVHDAYFVFKYRRAMPTESLMTLSTIRWLNK
jgi:cytochrome c